MLQWQDFLVSFQGYLSSAWLLTGISQIQMRPYVFEGPTVSLRIEGILIR